MGDARSKIRAMLDELGEADKIRILTLSLELSDHIDRMVVRHGLTVRSTEALIDVSVHLCFDQDHYSDAELAMRPASKEEAAKKLQALVSHMATIEKILDQKTSVVEMVLEIRKTVTLAKEEFFSL